MTEYHWSRLKWVKFGALLLSIASVYYFDQVGGTHRKALSIEENFRDLRLNYELAADILKTQGPEAFPLRSNKFPAVGQWSTMEAFIVDADKATYLSPPMMEPAKTLYERSKKEGYSGRKIDNWSEPIKAARSGNHGTTIAKDYRGVDCITSYGLVETDAGQQTVLIFKLDLEEAVLTAEPNYWDEICVTLLNGLVGVIIYFVHRHRDQVLQEAAETKQAAEDVIEINEELTRKLASYE